MIWSSVEMRPLLLAGAALGVALNSVELLWAPRLAQLLGDVGEHTELFGYFSAAGFAAAATGSLLGPHLAARLGHPTRAAIAGTAGYAASLALLAAADTLPAAVAAFAATYVFLALAGLMQRQLLHQQVPNQHRATMLSVTSLALMAGLFTGSLVLPRIAQTWGIPTAWATAAALLMASSTCYLPLHSPPPTSRHQRPRPLTVPNPGHR